MHDVDERLVARGVATVERGKGIVAAVIGRLFGFPATGAGIPLTVTFTATANCEQWHRSFAGKTLYSTQELGRGHYDGLLIERFGPFAFSMTVPVRDRRLNLEIKGGWCLGVPLPSHLLPRIEAFEHDADGRFNFHVALALPVIGRLVRYTGWLVPESSGDGDA